LRCHYLSRTERQIADFWTMVVEQPTGCRTWTGQTLSGYGKYSLGHKKRSAHRIAYELTYGSIPTGLSVCHRCDVKLCCNPEHLFLGTQADNNADMRRKGRAARGETHGSRTHPERLCRGADRADHKLTEDQVRTIRKLPTTRANQRVLAHQFGVSASAIRHVIYGESWRHVV